MDTINTRLKEELMDKQGLTSYAIAKRLELYISTVDSWLAGRIKNKKRVYTTPSATNVVDICNEFKLDLVYIMTGVKGDKSYPLITVTPKAEKKPVDNDLKDKIIVLYEKEIASLTNDLADCKQLVEKYKKKCV